MAIVQQNINAPVKDNGGFIEVDVEVVTKQTKVELPPKEIEKRSLIEIFDQIANDEKARAKNTTNIPDEKKMIKKDTKTKLSSGAKALGELFTKSNFFETINELFDGRTADEVFSEHIKWSLGCYDKKD